MSRTTRFAAVFVFGLVLSAAPVFAEEYGSSTSAAPPGGEKTGGSATSASEPAAPSDAAPETPVTTEAPAAPAPVAPPALKPITITFSGEVASVAATDNPPMITVQDRYGVKKEISVPAEAKISAGTAAKNLADLKSGDKVTVEYTYDVATGKRTAQTITLGEAAQTES